MKEQLVFILFVATLVLGFFTSESEGTSIQFYSDGIIDEPNVYLNVGVWNDATVDMYGGAITNDLAVRDESTFNLRGGSVSEMYNDSIVNVYGGEVTRTMTMSNSAITNIYGGSITCSSLFYASTSATFNIYGGSINVSGSSFRDGSTVNIYGYDFDYDPGSYILTGFLADDSPFTLNDVDNDEYGRINLIPEPASVLLFGLGSLALIRIRRR
jgi:hypothetical protein